MSGSADHASELSAWFLHPVFRTAAFRRSPSDSTVELRIAGLCLSCQFPTGRFHHRRTAVEAGSFYWCLLYSAVQSSSPN